MGAIVTNPDNIGYFNPPNVYRPAIIDIRIVGEYSAEDGATNTYRITQNDGKIFEFDVKNGSGGSAGRSVTSVEQIQVSTESLGKNVARIKLSDGTYTDVEIRNGAQGEVGPRGERGPAGIDSVEASIGTNDPTQAPSVDKDLTEGVLSLTFNNIKGEKGNQGEPAVAVENYVTAEATSSTTSATDVLPATGSADTVYRVSNWDGTQYNTNAYTEYGWYDGAYKMLATRTPGIDDEPTAGSQKLVKSGGVAEKISQLGQYEENPEFVEVHTDAEDKVLYGVKQNGDFYFGAGVPSQVDAAIDEKLAEGLNDKVDKEEGKSLIDAEYAASKSVIDNPEYLDVTTDAEDKILEGNKQDGTKVIGADLEVGGDTTIGGDTKILGNMEVSGVSYNVIENPEYLAAWVDAEDKVLFGLKADGKTYVGDADFLNDIKDNQKAIAEIKTTLANISSTIEPLDIDALYSITVTENPEYMQVETDSEGKILSGRRIDGTKFENLDFEVQKKLSAEGLVVAGTDITDNIEAIDSSMYVTDIEDRINIKTDGDGKIISFRDKKGILHEIIGVIADSSAFNSSAIDSLSVGDFNLSEKAAETISNVHPNDYVEPNLPKYGTINLTQETFFLEADSRVSSINDVVPIQDYPNTNDNANLKMTPVHYYIKGTLTDNGDGTYSINANSVKLRHFAFAKVKLNSTDGKYYAKEGIRKVNGVCYYLDTLVRSSSTLARVAVKEGYSVEAPFDADLAEGASKMINTEVIQLVGTPVIDAWTVENYEGAINSSDDDGKRYNHRCLADIDFGHYYSKRNVPLEIKLQGQSTSAVRKHGYRFTFYKKNDYAKKDKIKIGEMIRLSGYNLKAEMGAVVPALSTSLYRIFIDIWEHRPLTDRYDWDNAVNGYFHGATGIIKDFPVQFNAGGEFYGIYYFGLKKDEKNYMLDGTDEGGMFIQGAGNYGNAWGVTLPFNPADYYSEEMLDELSESNINALQTWHHFINNRLYKGSDGNEYNSTELTNVDGTMYVTSTLEGGEVVAGSVSATLIEFNKENAPERLDVLGFIDYFISLQVFIMDDSFHNNMVIYSNAEKKKFWPYFYDVNSAMRYGKTANYNNPYDVDFIEKRGETIDISFWTNLMDIYWDDIVNRYHYLRSNSLSMQKIRTIFNGVVANIPAEDMIAETSKWGYVTKIENVSPMMDWLNKRLNWLDENYFI